MWFVGEIFSSSPNDLCGTSTPQTLKSCQHWLLTILQLTNITSVTSNCGNLSLFLSFVILFSVLPSSFRVLGVKCSRQDRVLIFSVIPFEFCWGISELAIYQSMFHTTWWCTQEIVLNVWQFYKIHHVVQILYPMLFLVF